MATDEAFGAHLERIEPVLGGLWHGIVTGSPYATIKVRCGCKIIFVVVHTSHILEAKEPVVHLLGALKSLLILLFEVCVL